MSVVTRFAPSPTGYLHIGGARTALFNWLYAKKTGGQFLLRIEDTDRARSTQEAIDAILDGLAWLGLGHDGEVVYQFSRAAKHREVAEEMVRRGTAFRCYVTPAELEVRRQASDQARAALAELKTQNAPSSDVAAAQTRVEVLTRAFRSPYRDGGAPPSPDAPFVVRLRAPDQGEVLVDDQIQGPVRFAASDIDDLVLLRADGTPTYMLSVVVDDHDMAVTHIIRGDDHLTNAARQIPIYQAMGWTAPHFAHVPLIHGEDGKKLSKRHGAQAVHEWRDMGYLPEGMCAYLMRLGWSPGHDDILSKEEAVAQFDIAQIGKAPSRLDFKKLDSVNAHFMALADDTRLAALMFAHIAATKDWAPSEAGASRARAAIPLLKTRAKTIIDLADQTLFLLRERPLSLDAAQQNAVKDETKARLGRLRDRLTGAADWHAGALSQEMKAFAADEGVGMGQIGPALRLVLTGGASAPDLGQVLELLGRDEALGRISDQI